MNHLQRQIKHKSQSILEWVWCCILFLAGDSVYFKINDAVSMLFEIVLLLVTIMLILKTATRFQKKYIKKTLFIAFGNAIVLCIIILNSADDNIFSNVLQKTYILCFAVPIFYFLFSILGIDYLLCVLLKRYVTVVTAVAGIGLLLWILLNLNVMLPTVRIQYSWGQTNSADGVLGLVFPVQSADQSFLPIHVYRYTLFYVEGAIAAGYFLICLMLEICFNNKPRLWVCAILVCAALCTLSTYGLIATPVILLLCLMSSRYFHMLFHKSALGYACVLTLLGAMVVCIPLWIFFGLQSKQNIGSLEVHLAGYVGGFRAFMEKPFLGWGIGNYAAMNAFDASAGWTSPLMLGLTQGGIFYVLLIIAPFCACLVRSASRCRWQYAVFSIVMLSMYVNGCSDNSPFFASMIALAYFIYEHQDNQIVKANI